MAKKISIERHKEIGAELKEMHDRLTTLAVEVGNSSGGAEPYRKMSTLLKKLLGVRHALEERMFRDHTLLESTKIYFGPKE